MTKMRTPTNIPTERAFGEDAFGTFHITGGPCTNCNATEVLCVHYRFKPPILPNNIKPTDTILREPDDTYLGINCGCYAKLHRQVTHIADKIKARS